MMRPLAYCLLPFALGCAAKAPDPVAATPAPAPAPAPAPVPPPTPEPPVEEPSDVRRVGALVLDGVPEVPAEISRAVEPYRNVRQASLTDIRDDGRAILVSTRFGETSQVHLVTTPLGMRKQITFSDEPVRSPRFAPGAGDAFYYVSDRGGNEQYQLYRRRFGGGLPERFSDGEHRTLGFLASPSGKKIIFSNNARNDRDFDLWLKSAEGKDAPRLLTETSGYWIPIDWTRDERQLLALEYRSITDSRLHLVDVATGKARLLTPEQPTASYRGGVFSADGKRVYLASDREGEFNELYELDIATGKFRPLSRGTPWDVEGLALSPRGNVLAYTVNEGGTSTLSLLDTRTRRATRVTTVPKGIVSGLQFARGADVLAFTLSSATRTGDAYTYDLRKRRLVRWTESEMAGLEGKTLVEPERIDYVTFDKAKIPAFYYRPSGNGPFPVVVAIHGGPEGQSRPRFSALTQYLVVEKKIAVLFPNVRGSAGYGKTYVTLDNGRKREDSVKDIGALLDWVGARPELDEKRVAVYGGSYGGYMVLASLVHFGERLVAGVDIVGISDFVTFLENTADYRRNLRRVEYGDESDPEMRAFLKSISPLGKADQIKSALFVAQGANDPRVPASEAEQIVKAVRAAGKDVWYMLAENEGHGFARKENRDFFLELSAMFLIDKLLNDR